MELIDEDVVVSDVDVSIMLLLFIFNPWLIAD